MKERIKDFLWEIADSFIFFLLMYVVMTIASTSIGVFIGIKLIIPLLLK